MNEQIIAKKIIEDATSQAEQIVLKAKADAENTICESKKSAENLLLETKQSATASGELLIERRKTVARLDAKKIALSAKQALVLEAYKQAGEKLRALSKNDYLAFIEKQLKTHAEKEDVVVICNSAPITEEEVKNLPVYTQLCLGVKRGENFGGGIKLISSKCDKDLSFEAILSEYASVHGAEVSAILFK